jgi:uncharacterized protein YhbP (UPF0306 family)
MDELTFTDIRAQDVAGRSIEGRDPLVERARDCLFRILRENVLCSMATVTRDGRPHINTAYFSFSDRLELYFLSHPGSLHCQNLSGNPGMALTVFATAQRWAAPGLGVQLFGAGEETSGASAVEAERSYAARFRTYSSWKAAVREGERASQYRFYRVGVTEIKILDEARFGDAVWVVGFVRRR